VPSLRVHSKPRAYRHLCSGGSIATGSAILREDSRATEGTGGSGVLDTNDADAGLTGDGAAAGHAGGHLDFDGEVGCGGAAEAEDCAWDIGYHLGGLELWDCVSRCGLGLRREG
jgi:hypothetical protein